MNEYEMNESRDYEGARRLQRHTSSMVEPDTDRTAGGPRAAAHDRQSRLPTLKRLSSRNARARGGARGIEGRKGAFRRGDVQNHGRADVQPTARECGMRGAELSLREHLAKLAIVGRFVRTLTGTVRVVVLAG